MGERLTREFFARSVHEVAPELIGATLLVDGVGGTIVEVEAYDQDDPASHGFRGLTRARRLRCSGRPATPTSTARTGSTGASTSSAPRRGARRRRSCARSSRRTGSTAMRERRGLEAERALCSGPGKLCQALGITRSHDGLALDEPPFELLARESEPPLVVGPRIGITRAVEQPWRYGLAGSPFLSRRF